MMPANPFQIMDTVDGRALHGRLERQLVHLELGDLKTLVAVCGEIHGNADPVLTMPGLWAPEVGATVQLADPNRDAKVCSVRYGVDRLGLHVIVYLDDEATTGLGLTRVR